MFVIRVRMFPSGTPCNLDENPVFLPMAKQTCANTRASSQVWSLCLLASSGRMLKHTDGSLLKHSRAELSRGEYCREEYRLEFYYTANITEIPDSISLIEESCPDSVLSTRGHRRAVQTQFCPLEDRGELSRLSSVH